MSTIQVLPGSGTEVFFGILHPSLLAQSPIPAPPDSLANVAAGGASAGTSSIPVSALTQPIPAGSALRFFAAANVVTVTLDATAAKGATSLTVTALSAAVPAGSKISFPGIEYEAEVTTTANSGATAISVKALKSAIADEAVGYVLSGAFKVAYVSADAAIGATALSVLPLDDALSAGDKALHRGLLKLQGGTSTGEEISTDEETIIVFGDERGYSTGSATGASWSISYDALAIPGEPGYYRLSYAARNAVKGVTGYVRKRDTPPAGFIAGEAFEGICQAIGISKENPADGNITFSTSFNGRGEPITTPPRK
jgi:hypothetical protein